MCTNLFLNKLIWYMRITKVHFIKLNNYKKTKKKDKNKTPWPRAKTMRGHFSFSLCMWKGILENTPLHQSIIFLFKRTYWLFYHEIKNWKLMYSDFELDDARLSWIRLLEVRIVNCRPSWDGVDGDACSYGVWWDCSQVCTTWEQAWVSLNWVHHFTLIFLMRSKE